MGGPPVLLLPSEPHPLEKKNKELAAELNRHKSREPALSVLFDNGEDYARFRLVSPKNIADPEPDIQAKLARAREKVKPVDLKPKQELDAATLASNPFAQIAESI